MAITFNCTCGQQLQVDDEYAGAQAQCPDCNKVLTVPTPTAAALPVAKRPVADRPSKRREPVETDDDLGADADTLDPFAARRKSKRKRDDEGDPTEDEEEDRPSKRSKRLADDDDDDDYRDRSRKKKRKKRNEQKYNIFNNQTVGGAVLMFIPIAIELVAIIFFDSWIISIWMIIMFVAGLITMIKGLVTGRGE